MPYTCPKCQAPSRLRVVVEVWADLTQDEDGSETSLVRYADQHWDENSHMQCVDCGHDAPASEFDAEKVPS